FFFSSRRRHTRCLSDWSSDVCSSDLNDFREQHSYVDVIVCSRTADYELLVNKLKMNGAVVVQNLSDAQIDTYLQRLGPGTLELRSEERRVGKECRYRGTASCEEKKRC